MICDLHQRKEVFIKVDSFIIRVFGKVLFDFDMMPWPLSCIYLQGVDRNLFESNRCQIIHWSFHKIHQTRSLL